MTKEVFLAAAVRTPIGRFGGALAGLTAADMGVVVARESLRRAGLEPGGVQDVLWGCARQAGGGPNVARQIAYRAGVPESVPAATINKACGSGLKAIILAAQEIMLGRARAVLAGGVESMSRVPYFAEGARFGMRMGNAELVDGMHRDGFLDPLSGSLMGETAENLARQYQISRDEQDEYALRSQQRAAAAIDTGRFDAEIVPVELKGKRGESTLFVLGADALRESGAEPQARLVDYEIAGVAPEVMGIGPVPAIRRLLERQKLALADIDLVELNEAFAAQVIACDRELGFDPERLNTNGGAIALGHPIGCTGVRITTTLLHEMKRRKAHRGLATLCVSGGMGLALLVERV